MIEMYIFENLVILNTLFIAFTAFITPSLRTSMADLSFPDTMKVDFPAARSLLTGQVTPVDTLPSFRCSHLLVVHQ